MKSRDEVLGVLETLGSADRRWIIERLSPAARAALLGAPPRSPTRAPASSSASESAVDEETRVRAAAEARIRSAPAEALLAVVWNEPAWVMHALLQDSPSSARETVIAAASTHCRNDIARLEAAGVRYSKNVVNTLVVAAAQRLEHHKEHVPAVRSGFLGALATRLSRRRLRLQP